MPQVPWVKEQHLAHLAGKSKALRSLFQSLSTSGVIWDKVGCRGEWVRKGGFRGCRTPGLSTDHLTTMAGAAWGDLQHLWQGGVKQNCFICRNCLSQGSVFRQTSAFSSPTIHSLHRGAELQGPAVPSPGSGQRPQGRQCLKWGAAGRGCAPGLCSSMALPGMLWEVAALWAFWHPPRRSEHH